MNKRIRKKKHKGEFQEYLLEINVIPCDNIDMDKFCDDFVDMIESINCFCCGGFKKEFCEIVVELGAKKDNPLLNKDKIENWLNNCEDIKSYEFGNIIDSWYECVIVKKKRN